MGGHQSAEFQLRYSSYRGLHLNFDGRYWEAFRVYVLLTIAIPLSLGFAYPYVAWRRKQFFVDNTRYGTSSFGFNSALGHFYTVYIVGWLCLAGLGLAVTLVVAAMTLLAGESGLEISELLNGDDSNIGAILLAGVGGAFNALLILAFLVMNTAIQAQIANHVWQRTVIAGAVRFDLQLNM